MFQTTNQVLVEFVGNPPTRKGLPFPCSHPTPMFEPPIVHEKIMGASGSHQSGDSYKFI